MKKLLLIALLTSMFGTAHATRSRMTSLGQDANQGSFYFMDNRNFFRNPANAAKMRNFMVAELGNGDSTSIGNNLEGGFFGEVNSDIAYGVYLGKAAVVNNYVLEMVNAATGTDFLTSADSNPVNLFIAGGADMKWGLDINFGMSKREGTGDQKYNNMGIAAGIETSGGLQVYLSYPIQDEAKGSSSTNGNGNGDKVKTTGFSGGIIYSLNTDTTLFGQYSVGTTKITGDSTDEIKGETQDLIIGIGRIYELSPTARFNFDFSYQTAKFEVKGDDGKITTNMLPLNVGLEADATEWLILRASVKQNFLVGETKNTMDDTTVPASGTQVALGGTLHFGKLKIDGNLGTDGVDLFNSNEFFAQAAATYMF